MRKQHVSVGILVIGAGTVINPIVKIVTTVAILAAVYFFIVKPTLDTTSDITNRAFESSDQIQQEIRESIQGSGVDVNIPNSKSQAQKLGDCMQKAVGNVEAVQKCANRYGS